MSNRVFELWVNSIVNNLCTEALIRMGVLASDQCSEMYPITTLTSRYGQISLLWGIFIFFLFNLTQELRVAKIYMELWADSGIKVAL